MSRALPASRLELSAGQRGLWEGESLSGGGLVESEGRGCFSSLDRVILSGPYTRYLVGLITVA